MEPETTPKLPQHPKLRINKILDTIVWEEVEKEKELRHELTYLHHDSSYRPPEQYGEIYYRLIKALRTYLGEPDKEWKKEISNIMQEG
jgi:hypothetical protein